MARQKGRLWAIAAICTHRGAPLETGELLDGCVECPWHGSQFDTRTGRVKAGPAKKEIKTYEVEKRDGEVRLKL